MPMPEPPPLGTKIVILKPIDGGLGKTGDVGVVVAHKGPLERRTYLFKAKFASGIHYWVEPYNWKLVGPVEWPPKESRPKRYTTGVVTYAS